MAHRILIVDDEADLREIIAFDLNLQGFETVEAENGKAAFELCRNTPVDLIISDLRMSGGDGMQLLREIKSQDREKPPVLLVTGFSDIAAAEAYAEGASGLLAKPFERAEILRVIRRTLSPLSARIEAIDPNRQPKATLSFKMPSFEKLPKGAGGFMLPADSPGVRIGERVSFRVSFESGSPKQLVGTGWVRYVGENKTGIEVESLEDESRALFVAWVESQRPVSFLPLS